MNYLTLRILGLFIFLVFVKSCSEPTPYDHVPHDVRPILEKGIEQAGGLDSWNKNSGLQFNKRSVQYSKEGNIESKSNQIIKVIDQSELTGTVTWNNRTDTVITLIKYKDEQGVKYVNEVAQSVKENESASDLFIETNRAMGFPFNLLNHDVELSAGEAQVQFGKQVKVIVAEYSDDDNDRINSSNYWHYFDENTFEHLGYKLSCSSSLILVENETTTKVNGITYPVDRTAWVVDSLDNKQYITERIAYSEFKNIVK